NFNDLSIHHFNAQSSQSSQPPQPPQPPSSLIHHRIDDSAHHILNSYQFRYLSALNSNQTQTSTMTLANPYATATPTPDIVATNNIFHTTPLSSTGYWGIPPHADLAQWTSFMEAQQNNNHFSGHTSTTTSGDGSHHRVQISQPNPDTVPSQP
ncbi:10305_t:CDS:1, partial [Ambispora leptoticha]